MIRTILSPIISQLPQSVQNWKEKRYFGKYGEIELHLMEFLCDRQRDAIDVGGNDGCYVHFMLPNAKRVITFEPFPYFVAQLNKKFRGRAVIETTALSNDTGQTVLQIPVMDGKAVTGCSTIDPDAASHYPHTGKVNVKRDKLDNVYKDDVSFVKIDVEGHEQAVLEGAVETIKRCKPRVMVELVEYLGDGCIGKAETFFSKLGYRGYYIRKGAMSPISTFNVKAMQNTANMPNLHGTLKDRPRFPDYIYNFIFLPWGEPKETIEAIDNRLNELWGGRVGQHRA